MWSCVLIFLHYGFSLDTSNLQQSSGGQNKQYLTVSEFIDESYHQQRQLQRKFTLLASQLTLKLAALEQKINEKGVKKEICKESVQLLENINELAKNYTKLQHDFEILHEKYIAQNEELKLFRNKTNERDTELTIQPLQDFHALQKEVQSISKQTQALSLTQNARSEDIQSLYNETKGEIANLAAELQNFQYARSKDIQSLYNETNGEIANLAAELQNFQYARSEDIQSLYNETKGEIANLAAELQNFQYARSEDIQSLYNETNGEIANLAAELQKFQSNLNLTLADLERKMHLTISSLDAKFQNNLQSSENSLKSSLTVLHQLVDRSSERGSLA
jgi:DNA repair exonuclease SbcCD ATPase subunit